MAGHWLRTKPDAHRSNHGLNQDSATPAHLVAITFYLNCLVFDRPLSKSFQILCFAVYASIRVNID